MYEREMRSSMVCLNSRKKSKSEHVIDVIFEETSSGSTEQVQEDISRLLSASFDV